MTSTSGPSSAYLSHDEATLRAAAELAVHRAMAVGCSAAGTVARASGGIRLMVRDGLPETAARDNSQSLAITAYRGEAAATVTTQSIRPEAIERAVNEAFALAGLTEAREGAALPPPEWLAHGTAGTDLFSPDAPDVETLLDTAIALEEGALAGGGQARLQLGEAAAAASDDIMAVANSQGFSRSMLRSTRARWAMVKAQDDGGAQLGLHQSVARRLADLDDVATIGARARADAIAQLGARPAPTGSFPVLFEARAAPMLIGALTAALSGQGQHQGITVLPGALGTQALPAHLDLIEDPFLPYALGSASFDAEGVAGSCRSIVEGGVVTGYLLDTLWARRLGMRSTGHASGGFNLMLSSRTPGGTRAAMLARLGTGLVVTGLRGGHLDPVSGVWSHAVSGYWVERGERVHAVQGATLAGNFRQMLSGIVTIGQDAEQHFSVTSGSILIDAMTIGGQS
jgi:PmbA protein